MMLCGRPFRGLQAALALCFLSSSVAALQDPPTAITAALDVDYVEIDLVITDKSGQPVRGLGPADFEILEDKKKVPITNFYFADGGEQGRPRNGLKVIIYVDNFNIRQASRNLVLSAMLDFFGDRMSDGELEVMIASYDGTVQVRQKLSLDFAEVKATLEQLRGEEAFGSRRDEQLQRASFGFQQLRTYAGEVFQDTNATLDALSYFVATLGGIAGHKSLFYISDGLIMTPLSRSLRNNYQGLVSTVAAFDLTERYEQLTALANTNRVTFYPINAHHADAVGGARREVDDITKGVRLLADATGGIFLTTHRSTSSFLEEFGRDFGAYYSIGFTPRERTDGTYHAIRVKLKRKGLRMRSGSGYVYRSPLGRFADRTIGAILLGGSENLHELEIQVDSQKRRQDGTYDISLVLLVPIEKLTLLEAAGFYGASARFSIAVLTSSGMTPLQILQVPLRIPASDLDAVRLQPYAARVNLRLPEGSNVIAVGLWDQPSGQTSFLTQELILQ